MYVDSFVILTFTLNSKGIFLSKYQTSFYKDCQKFQMNLNLAIRIFAVSSYPITNRSIEGKTQGDIKPLRFVTVFTRNAGRNATERRQTFTFYHSKFEQLSIKFDSSLQASRAMSLILNRGKKLRIRLECFQNLKSSLPQC